MGEFVFKMNEPKDYEYLLLCDGSTISEENYPELVAVLGGTQLPNLIDRFLQGSATAGTYKAAGLPNIEGEIETLQTALIGSKKTTGAFSNTTSPSGELWTGAVASSHVNLDFNASQSNPIYGNSTTVQPPAYTAKIYICYL